MTQHERKLSPSTTCSSNKSSITERMERTDWGTKGSLMRKDSFNNWSSDEDTNIMMNRMRTFFRNVITNAMGSTHATTAGVDEEFTKIKPKKLDPFRRGQDNNSSSKHKPLQLIAFEEKLTKLMRTVPGINETQVKEVVEYLSSEDTWSDSYDSSDYASSDIDLEAYGITASLDEDDDICIPDLEQSWLQEQISASCQEIVHNFEEFPNTSNSPNQPLSINESEDFQRETAIMYQKLMAKMAANKAEKEREKHSRKNESQKSPPMSAKVMQCISSRLVALMHEVSSSQSDADTQGSPKSLRPPTEDELLVLAGFVDKRYLNAPSRRLKSDLKATNSNDSTTSSNSSTNNYTVNPKGPEDKPAKKNDSKNSLRFSKTNSKSEEILDQYNANQEEGPPSSLKKSSSSEYNVWQGVNRDDMFSKQSSKQGRNSSAPNSNEKLAQLNATQEKGASGVVTDNYQRRGSLGLPSRNYQSQSGAMPGNPQGVVDKSISGSSSGMSDLINDDERWSWKGSFESALATAPPDQNSKRSRSGSSSTMTSTAVKKPVSGSAGELYVSSSTEKLPSSATGATVPDNRDQSKTPSNHSSKRSSVRSASSSGSTRKENISMGDSANVDVPIEDDIVPTYNPSKVQSARFRNSNVVHMHEGNVGGPPTTYKSTATATLASPSSSSIASSNTNSTHNSGAIISARNHSTNSLPRLGTSAITQKRSTRSNEQGTSGMMTPRTVSPDTLPAGHLTTTYKPSTIITTTAAVTLSTTSTGPANLQDANDNQNGVPLKSARYRPPGYRPSPSRKTSTSSRKTSVDSTNSSKYTGKLNKAN